MSIDLKHLITKIEFLGLDTQPLRDLYSKVRSKNFDISSYLHLLSTLQKQADRFKVSGCQPTSITLLLKQLDKKLKQGPISSQKNGRIVQGQPQSNIDLDQLKYMIEDTVRSFSGNTADSNKQLLNAIDTLNQSVKHIKKSDYIKQESDNVTNEIESSVFVNPIDEKEVEQIKTNVSINTQKGSSVKSKLDRLKSLKTKGDN